MATLTRDLATYRTATQHIIDAVGDISVGELDAYELGWAMQFDANFDPDIPSTWPTETLAFSVLSPRASTDMRTRANAHRGAYYDVRLSVFFPAHIDRRVQDANIWQIVYPALREALFSPSSWNRPTSGIISLEPVTSGEGFPAEAPIVSPDGARILSVLIGLRCSNTIT